MDLSTWREGINEAIVNIDELVKNGDLLLQNNSPAHAFFLFFTALEELAVAYFILERFNQPAPRQLKKFFKHHKKIPFGALKAYLFTLPLDYFSDFIELYDSDTYKKTGSKKSFSSKEYSIGKKIEDKENLWILRNRSIYLSLNQNATQFHAPQQLPKDRAVKLRGMLKFAIPNLKALRDTSFQFNKNYIQSQQQALLSKNDARKKITDILKLTNYFLEGSVEKIKQLPDVNPEVKDMFIDFILPTNRELTTKERRDTIRLGLLNALPIKELLLHVLNLPADEKYYCERLFFYFPNFFEELLEMNKKSSKNLLVNYLVKKGLSLPDIEKIFKENKKIDQLINQLVKEELSKNENFLEELVKELLSQNNKNNK